MFIEIEKREINTFIGEEVILFGAGSCGLRALEEFLERKIHVIAFCDNNPKLHGTKLKEIEIISPEQLKEYPDANIIITSTFEKEITEQLQSMGRKKIYIAKVGVLKKNIPEEKFHNNFLPDQKTNQLIYDKLKGKEPFFIGRLGSVELECLSHYLYFLNRKSGSDARYPGNVKMIMNINAGFFPATERDLDNFCELYLHDMKNLDIIWSMWMSLYEDMIYKDYFPETVIAAYDKTVFPYQFSNYWTKALEGKKVLVIHPFEDSIIENYKKRDKLFSKKDFIPEFHLLTLKAVQSIAGNKTEYKDWFHALRFMQNQMEKIDFDVALVGAGAYGLPLASYAKSMNKQAIHIGGILQLFFGIKGKAWNSWKLYNEYWTEPKIYERPEGFHMVEAGRYW